MTRAAPRRLHILLVEDEPEVAETIALLLSMDGHHVDLAADGLDALARLETARCDILICDVAMPRLDGISLYREIVRTRPALARRVGFVTANFDDPIVRRFLEETRIPAAAKPLTLDETRELVAAVLARA